MAAPMAAQSASAVRAAAVRTRRLSLLKASSIGFGALPRRVRTVGRQIQEGRPDLFDGLPDTRDLVAGGVVHHEHVARPERRRQDPPDVGEESAAVDRAVEHEGRGEALRPERADEGGDAPAAVRDGGDQARPARGATAGAGHAGAGPGLVEEDEAWRVEPRREVRPGGAGLGYVVEVCT